MKTHPAPLPPPPVKRLEPILPPMTDATLMNKQKLLNIVYGQLQGIVTHARFVKCTMLDSVIHHHEETMFCAKTRTCCKRLGVIQKL